MTSEIIIRRSGNEDAAAVRACVESISSERRFLAIVDAPSVDEIATFIAHPDVVQFVALDGDTIVGWADVRRMKTPGFRHRGVFGMGVISGYRHRGIGARLIAVAIDAADAMNVERLELQVFRSNGPAVHLYKTHGFAVEGEQPNARILDGFTDDLLLMCRARSTKVAIRKACLSDAEGESLAEYHPGEFPPRSWHVGPSDSERDARGLAYFKIGRHGVEKMTRDPATGDVHVFCRNGVTLVHTRLGWGLLAAATEVIG